VTTSPDAYLGKSGGAADLEAEIAVVKGPERLWCDRRAAVRVRARREG